MSDLKEKLLSLKTELSTRVEKIEADFFKTDILYINIPPKRSIENIEKKYLLNDLSTF